MHTCCLVIGNPAEEKLAEILEKFDFYTDNDEYFKFEDMTEQIKKDYENFKQNYSSLEHYISDNGYVRVGDKIGEYSNPNGQYDWYTIGGRWKGYLKLKEEIKNNYCLPSEEIKNNYFLSCDDYTSMDANFAYKEDVDLEKTFEKYKPYSIIVNKEYYDDYNTENFDEFVMKQIKKAKDKDVFVVIDMHC